MKRRDFLISSAALGTAMATGSLLAEPNSPASAIPYIDVHTHIGTTWNGDEELTPDALLKWMDEHTIEKAVLLPLVSPESSSYLLLTEPALAAAKAHPTRFIPFCCIDPRTSYQHGQKGLVEILKRYVDKGAKGFGEHKCGLKFDDPLMFRVYEACQDLKLPLLFHMDNQRGIDKPGLPALETALKAFPALNFIGHGPGFWASISGEIAQKDLQEYPVTKVHPGGALDVLMDKYANLYCDMSAGSGANAIGRDKEFGKQFLIRRQDRVLFGTDYLKPKQDVPQFALLKELQLPHDVALKIHRNNAIKLLRLA